MMQKKYRQKKNPGILRGFTFFFSLNQYTLKKNSIRDIVKQISLVIYDILHVFKQNKLIKVQLLIFIITQNAVHVFFSLFSFCLYMF